MSISVSLGEAWVSIRASLDQLDEDLKGVGKKLEKSLERAGAALSSWGRKLTLFVTTPILAFGVAAVKAASDLSQMEGLLRNTFGDSSNEVEAWGASTARAIGRARSELLGMATDFGAVLKSFGVSQKNLAPMAETLSQLAADIASFRNVDEGDVQQGLLGALTGKGLGLRKLGLDLSEVAMAQELVRMGYRGAIVDATAAQRAVAAYNLIIKQTKEVYGDAERNSNTFEAKMRSLHAATIELREEFGRRLLPIALKVVNWALDVGRQFGGLTERSKMMIIVIGGIAAAIGPLLIVLGSLVSTVATVVTVLRTLITALFAVGSAFFSLPGLIIVSIAAAVAAVMLFPNTLKKVFSLDALKALLDPVRVAFTNWLERPIGEVLNSVLLSINLWILRLNTFLLAHGHANWMIRPFAMLELPPKAEIKQETHEFMNDLGNTFSTEATAAKATLKAQLAKLWEGTKSVLGDMVPDDIKQFFEDLFATQPVEVAAVHVEPETIDVVGIETTFKQIGETIYTSLDDNLTRALSGLEDFGDAAKAILQEVWTEIVKVLVVRPLLDSIWGFLGVPLPTSVLTQRAAGGGLRSHQPSLVGEHGPELWIPGVSGYVVPNSKLAGMTAGLGGAAALPPIMINQSFNVQAGLPPQWSAQLGTAATLAANSAYDATVNKIQGKR